MWPGLLEQPGWDAAGFVDLRATHADPGSAAHEFCRLVQRAEWVLLFAWCFDRAGK
jgi:hypothetical protein